VVSKRPLYYTTTYLIRLAPEQLQVVRNTAERLEMSVSAYTRMCLGLENGAGESLIDLSTVRMKPRPNPPTKLTSKNGKTKEA
jgi:hypothetical protein